MSIPYGEKIVDNFDHYYTKARTFPLDTLLQCNIFSLF